MTTVNGAVVGRRTVHSSPTEPARVAHTARVSTVDLIPAPATDSVTFRRHRSQVFITMTVIFASVWLLLRALLMVATAVVSGHLPDSIDVEVTAAGTVLGSLVVGSVAALTAGRHGGWGTGVGCRSGVRGNTSGAGVPALDGRRVHQFAFFRPSTQLLVTPTHPDAAAFATVRGRAPRLRRRFGAPAGAYLVDVGMMTPLAAHSACRTEAAAGFTRLSARAAVRGCAQHRGALRRRTTPCAACEGCRQAGLIPHRATRPSPSRRRWLRGRGRSAGLPRSVPEPTDTSGCMGSFDDGAGRVAQQVGADPGPMLIGRDMQVVDQAPPPRIVVEHDMDEADHPAGRVGHEGSAVRCRLKARGPHRATIVDVPVKERVGIGAPVVPPPTVGMQ